MMLITTISLTEENDTAFTSNILPNAGTTTSNYSNAGFDGDINIRNFFRRR